MYVNDEKNKIEENNKTTLEINNELQASTAELEEKYPLNTRTSLQQSLIYAAQKDVNIAVATFLIL